MPTLRPRSPNPSASSSTSQDHDSLSTAEFKFLHEARDKRIQQEPITFQLLSEQEAHEFFGLEHDVESPPDMVELVGRIEAAREEHKKDQVRHDLRPMIYVDASLRLLSFCVFVMQPLSQVKILNGAPLAVTATLALGILANIRPAFVNSMLTASNPARASRPAASADKEKAQVKDNKRHSQDLPSRLRDNYTEIAEGESGLSRSYQAANRLESMFYELLSDEVRHQLRATLPDAFYATSAMSNALAPVFPDDTPSVRPVNGIPQVPLTLDEARKCLGISKNAICDEVKKRWIHFTKASLLFDPRTSLVPP